MIKKILKYNIEYYSEADESVIEEVLVDQDYKMGRDILKYSKNCILDLGAHIGCFPLYVRSLNTKTPLYCFEPDLDNFSLLKKNILHNRLKNITVSNTAVWDKGGEIKFYIQADNHNHSLLSVSDNTRKVNATTIPKIWQKYRLEKCDLLKMDIEGAEYQVLLSIPQDIWSKINSLIIEYHAGQVDKLKSLLMKQGYKTHISKSRYNQVQGLIFAER